uniref:Peptidase n=1 Tax=viral metagenome TaxID=1070528 RepID=A0A6C0EIG1_9ZZZZ
MDNLKTGDLMLFCGHTDGWMQYFSDMIKYATHSNYSHVGMVIKDPHFIDPALKGTYLWESSWEGKADPQDGKIKLGVQITPIDEVLTNFKGSKIIIRTVECDPTLFSEENLKKIHEVVYDKPYDLYPKDWIEALLQRDPNPQKINRFWCSALVGYIYTQCGVLKNTTDWSISRPSDFSLDGENLNFNEGCSLSKTETRIA